MILDKHQIEQLKQRNEALFENIYEETNRGVYSMIFSIVKDHAKSEDLMQDVYMRMLIKIDQYKVGTNFKNWLLQIAKNQAIDMYRKDKKFAHMDDEDIHHMEASKDENPEEEDQFNRMLSVLDDLEKTIVILKVVDDLSHKDIAKIVNKPLGTVLWLYQRALNKLKAYQGDVL